MGFLDSLFSSSSNNGGVPGYLRDDYKKFDLDPDEKESGAIRNKGKKMYCTMCRKIYNGGYMCTKCNNILVEWH